MPPDPFCYQEPSSEVFEITNKPTKTNNQQQQHFRQHQRTRRNFISVNAEPAPYLTLNGRKKEANLLGVKLLSFLW